MTNIPDVMDTFYIKISNLEKNTESYKDDIIYLKNRLAHFENLIKETNSENQISLNNLTKNKTITEKQIEEINLKLLDFNIFDVIKAKANASNDPKSNSDDVVFLIQSIDKKSLKKFEVTDERIKKMDDEIRRLKNEGSHFKSNFETNNSSHLSLVEGLDKIKIKCEELTNSQNEKDEIFKEFEEKFSQISHNNKLKVNKIKYEK